MKSFRSKEIKFLSLMFEQMLNKRMAKLDLDMTPTQTMILMILYDAQHPILQKDLEAHLYISHATTRGIVKRLYRAGMVETTTSHNDKRQVEISLSTQGKSLAAAKAGEINKVQNEAESQLVMGIPVEDLAIFDRTLKEMKTNIKGMLGK